jgi:hypothetical protein
MARTIPREVSSEDVGWLAGIIDGEGSITFQKPIKPQKSGLKKIVYGIHIVNTCEPMIDKCVSILNAFEDGTGKPLEKKDKIYRVQAFKSNKPSYQLTVRKYSTLRNVLEKITPHLTEKRIKAEKLLNFVRKRKLNTRLSEEAAKEFLEFTPVENERVTPEKDEATFRACR